MKHVCLCQILILLLVGATALASTLQVQVRSTPLREMPSFLSGVIMEIHYGQPVEVLAVQKDWQRVQVLGTRTIGWVHGSALTDRKIELASGDALSGRVSADELALAGKGFSPEVEAAFRAENQTLDYQALDRMEKIKIRPEESAFFLEVGGIEPRGGVK
ncbi:SH3 domain-containing protein [Desulfobotulus sp.]|jgi:uncharacterized protein YgiM (DUF1202 family)|uniref:SH3 domain-containing protein n=1 Tax=Desulfobotulus sp. TaxID=1940337 RepID=UPI002A366F59|nr:SH3 domain-containing protein [Desulfobotulus sp.]MDY0164454.1 SH3 domain-containing protein [Desulfobotulus sp.]